ncbi:MAG: glutamate 5-kinase [Myxococcales bacterium]|nr:glutamate 5-kinase [Myxococcales bacterium]
MVRKARRIVVKVGSGVLSRDGRIRTRLFGDLARQVHEAGSQREFVIVSSGAIAMGSRILGWSHPGRSIPEKQAAAAVGQIDLVETYRKRFARYDRQVGQVLVTRLGLQDRERFLNARNTLATLLDLGVVPIVNENDTVATEEIRFGDNDNLSATILNLVGGDLLVLLTDVDGLYERRPEPGEPLPARFDVVEKIDAKIRRAASGPGSAFGSGGMMTKLEAAQTAAHSGAATVVCNGGRRDVLTRLLAGDDVGTLFLPGDRLNSRKHWLAFTKRTRGELVLDAGAVRALRDGGKSLLPAGIVAVRGKFGIGDAVACVDADGTEIARGLSAYGADEVARILGLETRKIAKVLGYSNGSAVVHRDDLVVLDRSGDAASS